MCECASVPVCQCASVPVCQCASVQMCECDAVRDARGLSANEDRYAILIKTNSACPTGADERRRREGFG